MQNSIIIKELLIILLLFCNFSMRNVCTSCVQILNILVTVKNMLNSMQAH